MTVKEFLQSGIGQETTVSQKLDLIDEKALEDSLRSILDLPVIVAFLLMKELPLALNKEVEKPVKKKVLKSKEL